MSTETEESGTGRQTIARTVRLSVDVMARIQAVADHLGVSVGAYLTQAIGASLSRDEMSLKPKQTQDEILLMIARMMEQAAKE